MDGMYNFGEDDGSGFKNIFGDADDDDEEVLGEPDRPQTPQEMSNQTKKMKWSPEEDKKLLESIRIHGTSNWPLIASALTGRTGKQCRERWLNQLKPDLNRDDWTTQEDRILMQQQRIFGNSWSKIAPSLPGRSTNAIKNRWSWLNRQKNRNQRNLAQLPPSAPMTPNYFMGGMMMFVPTAPQFMPMGGWSAMPYDPRAFSDPRCLSDPNLAHSFSQGNSCNDFSLPQTPEENMAQTPIAPHTPQTPEEAVPPPASQETDLSFNDNSFGAFPQSDIGIDDEMPFW